MGGDYASDQLFGRLKPMERRRAKALNCAATPRKAGGYFVPVCPFLTGGSTVGISSKFSASPELSKMRCRQEGHLGIHPTE